MSPTLSSSLSSRHFYSTAFPIFPLGRLIYSSKITLSRQNSCLFVCFHWICFPLRNHYCSFGGLKAKTWVILEFFLTKCTYPILNLVLSLLCQNVTQKHPFLTFSTAIMIVQATFNFPLHLTCQTCIHSVNTPRPQQHTRNDSWQ